MAEPEGALVSEPAYPAAVRPAELVGLREPQLRTSPADTLPLQEEVFTWQPTCAAVLCGPGLDAPALQRWLSHSDRGGSAVRVLDLPGLLSRLDPASPLGQEASAAGWVRAASRPSLLTARGQGVWSGAACGECVAAPQAWGAGAGAPALPAALRARLVCARLSEEAAAERAAQRAQRRGALAAAEADLQARPHTLLQASMHRVTTGACRATPPDRASAEPARRQPLGNALPGALQQRWPRRPRHRPSWPTLRLRPRRLRRGRAGR
jgi:hypothetical protein